MKAGTLFTPGKEPVSVEPSNGSDFSLDELYGHIGGYVTLVHLPGGRLAVCHDEGLLRGLAPNAIASVLVGQPLVGPVLICDSKMIK